MSVAVQFQLKPEVQGPLDVRATGTSATRNDITALSLYAGLLRYETDGGGQFVVYDGDDWEPLSSMVQGTGGSASSVFTLVEPGLSIGEGVGLHLIDDPPADQIWRNAAVLTVGDKDAMTVTISEGGSPVATVVDYTKAYFRVTRTGIVYANTVEANSLTINDPIYNGIGSNDKCTIGYGSDIITITSLDPNLPNAITKITSLGLTSLSGTVSVDTVNANLINNSAGTLRIECDQMIANEITVTGNQITSPGTLRIEAVGGADGTIQCGTLVASNVLSASEVQSSGDFTLRSVHGNVYYRSNGDHHFHQGTSSSGGPGYADGIVACGTLNVKFGNPNYGINFIPGVTSADCELYADYNPSWPSYRNERYVLRVNGNLVSRNYNQLGKVTMDLPSTGATTTKGHEEPPMPHDDYVLNCYKTNNGRSAYFHGTIFHGGSTDHSSDDNLKSSTEFINDALGVLNQLKPCKYVKHPELYTASESPDLTDERHYTEIGLIAQDVEKIDYVKHTVGDAPFYKKGVQQVDSDGKPMTQKALNYIDFIPLLVKGVQELHAENAALRASLATLTARIDALEAGASTGAAEEVSVQ